MPDGFNLTEYLNRGSQQLVQDILKTTLRNPKETLFLRKYITAQRSAEERRMVFEADGQHIPLFLIASITDACNLFCKGCYARANGICSRAGSKPLLDASQWETIFGQAEAAGIPFVLLAGGEPMLRSDVILAAAKHEDILFPIFTNGTLMEQSMIPLLDRHRNLVPVISLEGSEAATDARRGEGTYRAAQETLRRLYEKRLLFGVSLTVTTENRAEVMSEGYVQSLYQKGCRLLFLIEYVPVEPGTESLAPDDAQRSLIDDTLAGLRKHFPGMLFLSFPGDEKFMGGCLAAGRGFFHINAHGEAEPCPFSPYSDMNLRNHTLLEALQSPFFERVRDLNRQGNAHKGGCALFENDAQVKALLFPQKA